MAAGTKITAGRELKFTDDLVVTTTNKSVSHPACYSLSGGVVTASPHTDQASHEVLLSETFGSVDWLWSADDEFRFGKTEGELRGLMLAVPEEVPGEGDTRRGGCRRARFWGVCNCPRGTISMRGGPTCDGLALRATFCCVSSPMPRWHPMTS